MGEGLRGENMIEKVCLTCRRSYLVKPYLINSSKFCSRECQRRYYSGKGSRSDLKKGRIVNCFTCGKPVYKILSRIKIYEHQYCSKQCMNQSPYKRQISSHRMKTNNPMFNPDIKKRSYGALVEWHKHNKPYNFIDGQSRNRVYALASWKKVIKEIYLRDKYECQLCGKKGGLLNVHHIIPYSICKSDSPENLITLCVKCHGKVHMVPRRKLK